MLSALSGRSPKRFVQGDSGVIAKMKSGTWHEAPNSNMDAVGANPVPAGTSGVKSIMMAWNSGAFDTKRGRLVVWGGGHGNYSGNEIYAFDVNKFSWERLTEPSSLVGWTDNDIQYQDGRPVSRHTYNTLAYFPPPYDKFFSSCGTVLFQSGIGDNHSYKFDFDTLEWETVVDLIPMRGIGSFSAWDTVTETFWQHSTGGASYMMQFDPATDTWTARGDINSEKQTFIPGGSTAVIDPVRRKFISVGSDVVRVWDISVAGFLEKHTILSTTGDTEITSVKYPGLDYDSDTGQIVAWGGGADIYVLDIDAAIWTKVPPAIENTVTPTSAETNGTYGRFRYMPALKAFIVVNRTNENVFIYKT
jgi:hypothetical protein